MSMKAKLTRQLIRSLNEHPEDWEFDSGWAVNSHIRVRIYKDGGHDLLDIRWKGEVIVKEWRRSLAPLVPWRRRLKAALRRAEDVAKMKRLSIRLEDTFETPTLEKLELIRQVVRDYMTRVQARR